MTDVAFVPKGNVFQSGDGISTEDAGEAGETFAGDGVALVRHGAGTFLAFGKKFLGFEHLRPLQMTKLGGPAFDTGADEGDGADEFGVNIALDDLGGDGGGAEAELLAD